MSKYEELVNIWYKKLPSEKIANLDSFAYLWFDNIEGDLLPEDYKELSKQKAFKEIKKISPFILLKDDITYIKIADKNDIKKLLATF